MKRYLSKLAGLVLVLFSFGAPASSLFGPVNEFNLILHEDGNHVAVVLATPLTNVEGCSNGAGMLILQRSHVSFKEIYAALLSTFHAKSSISGWVHECDPLFQRPILTRLDLVR